MKETHHLQISGMHCAACATRIEKVLSKMDGVEEARVNVATERGRVTFNRQRASLTEIIHKINQIGFQADVEQAKDGSAEDRKERETKRLTWHFLISALLAFPLGWAMTSHFQWASIPSPPALFLHPLFQLAIAIPIQFVIGFPFYDRAWKAVKNRSANMDVLVVLSTSAAFFYSHYLTFVHLRSPGSNAQTIVLFYETSAFIITFILLGKLLEARTKKKTSAAIQKLYHIQTKTATIRQNGKETTAPVESLSVHDVVIVKAGDRIPVDGQVVEGYSMVDESLLTGESIPNEKKIGSPVYAGTINQEGTLKVKVTKTNTDTALSRIIQIVEEAQTSKAPIQQIADKITGVFVPVIVFIALCAFAISYAMIQPGQMSVALEKMIAVLIIACPCALGLATPTSVMVGSGRGAQAGILFKEGRFLEELGKCDTIVLDKTGTITNGKPRVTECYIRHHDPRAFFSFVGATESESRHPLGMAILKEAKKHATTFPLASKARTIPGYGVQASIDGKDTLIANPRYFERRGLCIPNQAKRRIEKWEREGKTVVLVAIQSRFAGMMAIADEVKPSSKTAIARLKKMGFEVMMFTGDNEQAARLIAQQTGIHNVHAQIPPQGKAEKIQAMRQKGKKVVMVGDGMNDAPALTVANIGVAMGNGSDLAIESGDIATLRGDLNKVVQSIRLSQATMKNIKQNFVWAFSYNLLCVPFAMFGLLAPWLAGAVMAFSSISVVLNALRLQRCKI